MKMVAGSQSAKIGSLSDVSSWFGLLSILPLDSSSFPLRQQYKVCDDGVTVISSMTLSKDDERSRCTVLLGTPLSSRHRECREGLLSHFVLFLPSVTAPVRLHYYMAVTASYLVFTNRDWQGSAGSGFIYKHSFFPPMFVPTPLLFVAKILNWIPHYSAS